MSTGSCCLDRGFIFCCGVVVSLLLTASSETGTLSLPHSACTSVHRSGHRGPPLSAGCHHVATSGQLRAMLQSLSWKETQWIPRNYNNHVLTLCYQKEKHLRLRLVVCNNPETKQHYFQQWEENPIRRGYKVCTQQSKPKTLCICLYSIVSESPFTRSKILKHQGHEIKKRDQDTIRARERKKKSTCHCSSHCHTFYLSCRCVCVKRLLGCVFLANSNVKIS